MSKKLSDDQIHELARNHGIEYAALKAIFEVESRGTGFHHNGEPVILFEPHVFWELLGDMGYRSLRLKMHAAEPTLLYPRWGAHPYGPSLSQSKKLKEASELIKKVMPNLDPFKTSDAKILNDVREAALQSCSWGLGQVMGFHWKALGYKSIHDFVDNMRLSEQAQLESVIRYIKCAGLMGKLKMKNWKGFARGYNGVGYAKNKYDIKLAKAYAKYS